MTYVPHATFASCDGHDLNTSDPRRANPTCDNVGKVRRRRTTDGSRGRKPAVELANRIGTCGGFAYILQPALIHAAQAELLPIRQRSQALQVMSELLQREFLQEFRRRARVEIHDFRKCIASVAVHVAASPMPDHRLRHFLWTPDLRFRETFTPRFSTAEMISHRSTCNEFVSGYVARFLQRRRG